MVSLFYNINATIKQSAGIRRFVELETFANKLDYPPWPFVTVS